MRTLIFSAALVIAVGLLLGCRTTFSGDGVLTDNGFWSYPRYTITFDSFDITRRAHHSFKVKGVPGGRLTLGLVVLDPGGDGDVGEAVRGPDYEGAILHVEIRKMDGTVVAVTHAAVKEWQLSRSSERIMLWHGNLRDVRLARRLAYNIVIELSGASASGRSLVLRPVLEGGGNEVP